MMVWSILSDHYICNSQVTIMDRQWAVGSGQWAVGSGQWAVDTHRKSCLMALSEMTVIFFLLLRTAFAVI